MGKLTFSVALSVLFIAYISYSIWTIGKLFFPPNCDTTEESCISAYIASKPKLQLILLTSTTSKPSVDTQLSLLEQIDPFDYLAEAEKTIDVRLPLKTRRNGTLYLHAFLTRHRNDGDWRTALSDSFATYTSFHLTEYQVPVAQAFNLLGDRNDTEPKPAQLDIPVTHLKTRVVVNVLSHADPLPAKDLPMDLGHLLILSPKGSYLPTVYIDVLSSRLKDLVQINHSMTEYPVSFGFSPISLGKLRLWLQFASALQTLRLAGFTSKDIDEIKGIFTDTNVVFLCMTFFIAGIHLLFDFLAFKNDVAFWKSRENMVGLSTRTLLWRTFSQWVIVLYLLDENTSLLVLVPAIIGAVIEVWKVCKAFKVHVVWSNYIPRIRLGCTTNEEEETEKFDLESMKYLSYLLYPLCIAGAVYSLVYNPHRSWYSWVVNSLVNGVYAFGFLFMLPQLFVNYRLKSVAHLPWKAFMYKAFNTFIDDVFSFLITMPTAHRVACFRDDIVFLIYLYQRWLYPVDKSRVNEFGSTGEGDEKKTN